MRLSTDLTVAALSRAHRNRRTSRVAMSNRYSPNIADSRTGASARPINAPITVPGTANAARPKPICESAYARIVSIAHAGMTGARVNPWSV